MSFGYAIINPRMLDETKLGVVYQIKALGIYISAIVTWNNHIDYQIAKCTQIFNTFRCNLDVALSFSRNLM